MVLNTFLSSDVFLQPWGKYILGKGYKKTDDPSSDETSLPKWNGKEKVLTFSLLQTSVYQDRWLKEGSRHH